MIQDTSVPSGLYRHYKGMVYEVVGTGRHTETDELLVIYRPLEPLDGEYDFWIRPLAMFYETVDIKGVIKQRFEKIDG